MNFDEHLFKAEISGEVGVRFRVNRTFKPAAKMSFVAFDATRFFDAEAIVHFFMWDIHFEKIDTPEKFIKLLDTLKGKGVRFVCQTDFSCWYFNKKQRDENVIKNFEYLKLIEKYGFNALLNFNVIWLDRFDFYISSLPKKIDSVVFDFNHNEKKFAQIETETLRQFLKHFDVKNFFVFTGKKVIPAEYQAFFKLLQNYRIRTVFLPTEMKLLQVKRQKFYSDGTVIKSE